MISAAPCHLPEDGPSFVGDAFIDLPYRPIDSIVKSAVRVANVSTAPLCLRLEPWGRTFDLAGGATQNLDFEGPDGGLIELEVRPGEVTVYGWVGSTVDDHVNPETGSPVPQTPKSGDTPAR